MDRKNTRLINMAEQITKNLHIEGDNSEVALQLADHIRNFWHPLRRKARRLAISLVVCPELLICLRRVSPRIR
ncbi:MAG: formate dehydrogenase subunit delta, partial [Pseudomonadota bacterium]